MRRVWMVGALLAGCGRIGFDAPGTSGDGGGGDGAGDSIMIDAVPVSGLFAWYPLDDDFGGTLTGRDVSGNDRNLRCVTSSCPTMAAGRASTIAAQFDGASDVLKYSPIGTEANFTTFTVLAWVFIQRRPNEAEVFVGRPVGSLGENSFAMSHTATMQYEYFSEGGSLFGMSTIPLTTWVHVAISWDGVFKRIYVNGNPQGSANQGGTLTYDDHPLMIGADNEMGVDNRFVLGRIADVMIYGRALTGTEIDAISNM